MLLPGEEKQEWKMATLNSEYVEGQARFFKSGRLVTVIVEDFIIKKAISHGVVLISGIPEAVGRSEFILMPYSSTYNIVRLGINAGGTDIIDWYDNKSANAGTMYYGTITYLAK